MNPIDEQLNRLFRSAAKTESAALTPAYGLETRVLAAWRDARAASVGIWDMGLLWRGLAVAILIMGVSFLPVLQQTKTTTDPFSDYLQASDTSMASDQSP